MPTPIMPFWSAVIRCSGKFSKSTWTIVLHPSPRWFESVSCSAPHQINRLAIAHWSLVLGMKSNRNLGNSANTVACHTGRHHERHHLSRTHSAATSSRDRGLSRQIHLVSVEPCCAVTPNSRRNLRLVNAHTYGEMLVLEGSRKRRKEQATVVLKEPNSDGQTSVCWLVHGTSLVRCSMQMWDISALTLWSWHARGWASLEALE